MSQNQDNTTKGPRLPGSWVKIPVSAIQELTPSEYALWSVLQALCIAHDHCWPTVHTIGNYLGLGYTQTWSLLQSLQAKGWLTTEKQGRQVNYSPVTPSRSIQKTEEIHPESIQKSEEISPDPFRKLKSTSSENRRSTLQKTEDRSIKKEVQEKEVVPSSTVDTSKQNPTKKKQKSADSSDPRIKVVLDHFHDEHLRIHGEKPHIIGGRDGKAIQRILTTIPDVEEIKRRITAYLLDPLSWMDRPQWSITGFEKRINAYHPDNRSANPDHEAKPKARPLDLSQVKY